MRHALQFVVDWLVSVSRIAGSSFTTLARSLQAVPGRRPSLQSWELRVGKLSYCQKRSCEGFQATSTTLVHFIHSIIFGQSRTSDQCRMEVVRRLYSSKPFQVITIHDIPVACMLVASGCGPCGVAPGSQSFRHCRCGMDPH